MEQLIEQIVEELSADVRRQPYALFGHSLGALLAFEAAHKLGTIGLPQPLALFASGTNAPSRRDNDRFAGMESDEQLRAEMYKLNGTHSEVFASDELMALTLPVLRADFQLCGQYRYRRRRFLNLPLHVFGGDRDETTSETLEAWQQETSAEFSLDNFDGDHFFIQSHETQLLQLICRYLQS
jgi:surfactin synthase thioesterase subunit